MKCNVSHQPNYNTSVPTENSMSCQYVSMLSFETTHRRKFEINKIRDMPYSILYAHYPIYRNKEYGTEKKQRDGKGYLPTEPTPNMELFTEK